MTAQMQQEILLQKWFSVSYLITGATSTISSVPEQPSTTWQGQSRAQGYKGHVTIYIQIPNVEAALGKAEQLGGQRMLGPDEALGGVVFGQFLDPESHLIGVTSKAL